MRSLIYAYTPSQSLHQTRQQRDLAKALRKAKEESDIRAMQEAEAARSPQHVDCDEEKGSEDETQTGVKSGNNKKAKSSIVASLGRALEAPLRTCAERPLEGRSLASSPTVSTASGPDPGALFQRKQGWEAEG